ncbi:hypothetical protein MBANPS3_001439 [Mucor bainieri]
MDDEFDDILLDDYNIDTLDRAQPTASNLDNDNDESQATSTTKKPPKKKFNADLLLEPRGIPLLKSESKFLKFKKTRGHEHEDLKKLMTYYTVWANNLYPGLLIQDFARRVVNPAKSKPVRSLMDQWSNEFRERRQVQLDVRNELSGKTVGGNVFSLGDIDRGHVLKVMHVNLDDDGSDGSQPGRAAEDDESSEDDNRPLFFPVTNANRASSVVSTQKKNTATSKGKARAKPVAKPRTKAIIDTDDEEDDDEQPLFTSSQKQQQQQSGKRKIVLDDSSDDEDTYNMSRSSALALIIERKRKREQAQREQQERSSRPKSSATRTVIEDYDDDNNGGEPALFGQQDKEDEDVELALSDSELAALGIPTRKQKTMFGLDDDDAVEEDVQLALTDAELLELGLPVNKPTNVATTATTATATAAAATTADADAIDDDIQLALSDNELESLGLGTTLKSMTPTNNTQQSHRQQQVQEEEEQFSDNELFDIQEA